MPDYQQKCRDLRGLHVWLMLLVTAALALTMLCVVQYSPFSRASKMKQQSAYRFIQIGIVQLKTFNLLATVGSTGRLQNVSILPFEWPTDEEDGFEAAWRHIQSTHYSNMWEGLQGAPSEFKLVKPSNPGARTVAGYDSGELRNKAVALAMWQTGLRTGIVLDAREVETTETAEALVREVANRLTSDENHGVPNSKYFVVNNHAFEITPADGDESNILFRHTSNKTELSIDTRIVSAQQRPPTGHELWDAYAEGEDFLTEFEDAPQSTVLRKGRHDINGFTAEELVYKDRDDNVDSYDLQWDGYLDCKNGNRIIVSISLTPDQLTESFILEMWDCIINSLSLLSGEV